MLTRPRPKLESLNHTPLTINTYLNAEAPEPDEEVERAEYGVSLHTPPPSPQIGSADTTVAPSRILAFYSAAGLVRSLLRLIFMCRLLL